MAKVTYTEEEAKRLKDKADYERLDTMTDEQIEEAARNDPDAPPSTPEQLKKFKREKHRWLKK
jgi:hypothetical protein